MWYEEVKSVHVESLIHTQPSHFITESLLSLPEIKRHFFKEKEKNNIGPIRLSSMDLIPSDTGCGSIWISEPILHIKILPTVVRPIKHC